MEWENKTEMVRLHNQWCLNEVTADKWQAYAKEHVDEFDIQAWDMFLTMIELVPDEMEKEKEFHLHMMGKMDEQNIDLNQFGLRTAMRHAMYETICEDVLGYPKKDTI